MNFLEGHLYFLTWKFYNEMVAYTPLCQNQISTINFSSTYNISMNDEFFTYLSSNNIQIDIHETIGDSSKFFASSNINLCEILNNVNKKVEFKLILKSSHEKAVEDSSYGTVNCWCKLTM